MPHTQAQVTGCGPKLVSKIVSALTHAKTTRTPSPVSRDPSSALLVLERRDWLHNAVVAVLEVFPFAPVALQVWRLANS